MTQVLFGRLRRDTMILLVDADGSLDLAKEAEKAVKEGRAQEAFVVDASAYFTASDINWDPEGTNTKAASVPPLNPGQGEQETTDQSNAVPSTTLQEQRKLLAEEAPKGVDTGSNPDLTPTGVARTDKEVAEGKPTEQPAKTSAFDAEIAKAKESKKA